MALGFTRVAFSNFRSFDTAELEPQRDVTWLMGRNASGKFSFLDALVFPCDVLRVGLDALTGAARGRPTATDRIEFPTLLRDPTQPATWDLRFEDETGGRWRYRLVLEARRSVFGVLDERLERLDGDTVSSVLENEANGARIRGGDGVWRPVGVAPQRLLLSDAAEGDDAMAARRFLEGVWLFRPDPLLMRGDRFVRGAYPDRYGRDLDALLQDLDGPGSPDAFRRLIASIERTAGWSGVRSVEEAPGYRRVHVTEADVLSYPLVAASDGQLLAAWFNRMVVEPPERWTVALLDEPAIALAPDVLASVFDWALDLAEVVQVLAATHDKPAVNRASRDQVVMVVRSAGQASRLVWLRDTAASRAYSDLFKPGEVAVQAMREVPVGSKL